jgi:hypothetical protein
MTSIHDRSYVPAVKVPPWRDLDREDIRIILGLPATQQILTVMTTNMNSLADFSPPTVTSVQTWIDQWKALDEQWSIIIASGDVAGSYATEYEGLRPGAVVTRDDMLSKADVLEWDTETQFKVKISGGSGSGSSLAGAIRDQMTALAHRICSALSICHLMDGGGSAGNGQLLRS